MKILTTLACLFAAGALAADSPSTPLFQLRRISDKPSADSEQMTIVGAYNGRKKIQYYNVEKTVLLDQSALKSASVQKDDLGRPAIDVKFTKAGGEKFADVTRQNIGSRLGILINGRLYEAPVVRTPITGGKASITGSFTAAVAENLAARINAAAAKSADKF